MPNENPVLDKAVRRALDDGEVHCRKVHPRCHNSCLVGRVAAVGGLIKEFAAKKPTNIRLVEARMLKAGRKECLTHGQCRRTCIKGATFAARGASWALASSGLRGVSLGIIVSPGEKCKKGFTEKFVKSKLNKKVKICFLDKGYRKHDPEKHRAPYRRLRKFGPGIEHEKILEREAHRHRKAQRVLTED